MVTPNTNVKEGVGIDPYQIGSFVGLIMLAIIISIALRVVYKYYQIHQATKTSLKQLRAVQQDCDYHDDDYELVTNSTEVTQMLTRVKKELP